MAKLRHHKEFDDVLLEKWWAADDEHSQTTNLDFWLPPSDPAKQHKGTKYLAVEDEHGTIAYLVFENCLRIHVQFAPPSEIDRTRIALAETLTQIQKWARDQYKEIIFESKSRPLVFFLRKFGFRKSENEIVCKL